MMFNQALLLTPLVCVVVQGKGLWSRSPATYGDVIKESFPIGNGRFGVLPFGSPGAEKLSFNIDSLWSGGPFENSSYTGGNPSSSVSEYVPGIREWIFQNGTGNVSQLLGDSSNYGSYQVYANLSVVIDGVNEASNYNRSLDFDTGLHTTVFTANDGKTYTSTVYCSYPDQVCVYNLASASTLPQITIALENQLTNSSLFNATCGSQYVRLAGVTQLGPPLGMKYDGIARLVNGGGNDYCSNSTAGTLVIPSDSQTRSLSLVLAANTNYDQLHGNAAYNFSFKGVDPGPYVESTTLAAASKAEPELRQAHVKDYQALMNRFTLELPDTASSAGLETAEIIDRYNYTGAGDPYLESTLFDYGRHLFISSSRENSLPPNLQGRWSSTLTAAWSADYHANINLQMNHWGADQTGVGELQAALWNYMHNTWVPRGTQTAQLLYAAPGWVTHDEMNIFGHTGMKNEAQWANYPASAAWMMQHVFDHFSYSQNATWFREQGYPLMKGVAQFWLSQLEEDDYFNDGTVVVNPCNSPEHGPTTFACTHYQQLIHQLFASILSTSSILPSTSSDLNFLNNISTALAHLDKGLHIGNWGEIKEWKIPDTFGYDFENDTHRHLSNLYGWFPGDSIASLQGGYSNTTIQNAVATTLWSRGIGTGPDADAGWEKIWRSACWARLNETERAYFELRYAIDVNFADNGLSMYDALEEPFQIDANLGLVGAVLSMLVVDLLPKEGEVSVVVLGPAIPSTWGGGSVKGLRLRGGGSVDFWWDGEGVVSGARLSGRVLPITLVDVSGKGIVEM